MQEKQLFRDLIYSIRGLKRIPFSETVLNLQILSAKRKKSAEPKYPKK